MHELDKFFEIEVQPKEFAKILDEVEYLIAHIAIAKPHEIPETECKPEDMIYYIRKLRKVLNKATEAQEAPK